MNDRSDIFIRIDSKIVEQARKTDVIAFFEKHCGFTFTNHGGGYRCTQHPSFAVKNDCLSWYWHSKGVGGCGVLDYLIKVENMPFRDAVGTVMGIQGTDSGPYLERHSKLQEDVDGRTHVQLQEQPKTLILPEKAGFIPYQLYEYLCNKRGIDSSIVNKLIQEGKLYEDKRGNIVFIGYDKHNEPRFASLRGTYGDCQFRRDCAGSDKRFGFNMGCTSERLYVFESPIDAMSHASLENAVMGEKNAWKGHCRLSLAGTSDVALQQYLGLSHLKARTSTTIC